MTPKTQPDRGLGSLRTNNPTTKEMANMGKGRSQGSLLILKWDLDKQISSQALSLDRTDRAKADIRRDSVDQR